MRHGMDNHSYIKRHGGITLAFIIALVFCVSEGNAKVRKFGKVLRLRDVNIRNVAYNANGTIFAVPNYVSAGSVALFWVNQKGEIARVPSRLSDKHFMRSSGLYFLRKRKTDEPGMGFMHLPELLSGYSVDFSGGDTLAVAGGGRVWVYRGDEEWKTIKEITVAAPATRAVFSHNGKWLAVITNGKLMLFSTDRYELKATVEPREGAKFADVAFSHDGRKCALFEYRALVVDYSSRIRIYDCEHLRYDRDLPYFPVKPSQEPGAHLPLVSYFPGDTLLAVTVHATFSGKIFCIKSNDGSVAREFKGFCHALSRDGTLFVADNTVFSLKDWSRLGKISGATVACTFSPTERVLVTITNDAVRRFRVEEK